MKILARFYKNPHYIDDGTTKYFIAVASNIFEVSTLLHKFHSMRLLHHRFIDQEHGQLQIEKDGYSLANGDELVGRFVDNNGIVIYEID